jgi:hypothetical protein
VIMSQQESEAKRVGYIGLCGSMCVWASGHDSEGVQPFSVSTRLQTLKSAFISHTEKSYSKSSSVR